MAENRYSVLQRSFHWIIAVLVLGNLAGGLIADTLGDESDLADQIMGLHMSTGMLILLLVVARLITRLVDRVPGPLAAWPEWQKKLTMLGHWTLYALILIMPVSGYLMVTAHEGNAPGLYGLFQFPALVGENESLHDLAHDVHGIFAWVLIVVVLGHVGFALKHHFLDRDKTLRRMTRGE